MSDFFVCSDSVIDDNVKIGSGTKIWHFSHIQSGAIIGENCVLGQNVNLGNNVKIGNGCKIQNNVSLYEGAELEDYVFCGPSCVFTNDLTPRSEYPKESSCYRKTLVKTGATIGANATIVCGHTIGRWAMIAAGAVVTKDVKDHALMAGVPARRIGWVCRCGEVLGDDLKCKKCARQYSEKGSGLVEKEADE
ncbi:MAG: N-acetyltransferase [Clostridiales bacterium]|nr:N-acetyltransferase [Clostridiales bacterium]